MKESSLSELGHRIARIELALGAALEARGHSVDYGQATVNGVDIRFYIYEAGRQRRVQLTRKDIGYRRNEVQWRQVLVPSGQPTLVAMPLPHGGERRWTDKPGKPVEAQIERIVARFEAIAAAEIKARIRIEEYEREVEIAQRKAARRLMREQQRAVRPKRLRALAADWRQAAELHEFLDALEARLADRPPSADMARWVQWARDHVDALDPLTDHRLAALQAHAEAVAPSAEDGEEMHPYEMEWRDMGELDKYL